MTSMRVLAAAGLLVLTIAGCGTGGSTSPASTAPAPTSTDSSASGGPLASTTTAPGGSDAPDGTPTVVFDDSPPSTSPASPSPELVITEVRVGSHAGYDRIVVELTGGSPDQVGWRVEYDDEPRTQGKGDEVDLPGSATLRVIVTGRATGSAHALMTNPLLRRLNDLQATTLMLSGNPADSGKIRGQRFGRLPAGRAMLLADSDEPTYLQLVNPLFSESLTR